VGVLHDYDFLHIVNWEKAAEVVAAGNCEMVNGVRTIRLDTAIEEGLLYFAEEPRNPHGVDISPDGNGVLLCAPPGRARLAPRQAIARPPLPRCPGSPTWAHWHRGPTPPSASPERNRPMSARIRLILTTAVTALVLSACGGDGDTTAGDDGPADAGSGAVTVVATEFAFDPDTLSFPSGTTVSLDNQGVIEHDFTVEGHEDDILIYTNAGETAEGTVDLPAGDYTFYCTIPGHRASGMEGDLTIE
jgi:plastocyanin